MEEIFTKEQIEKIEEAFRLGANKAEVCVDVPVSKEDLCKWLSINDNDERMKDLRIAFLWQAKKLFHSPKDHREAEAVLKRHPLTKKDYSDRTEHTGAEGKDLQPILVKFIDGKTQS